MNLRLKNYYNINIRYILLSKHFYTNLFLPSIQRTVITSTFKNTVSSLERLKISGLLYLITGQLLVGSKKLKSRQSDRIIVTKSLVTLNKCLQYRFFDHLVECVLRKAPNFRGLKKFNFLFPKFKIKKKINKQNFIFYFDYKNRRTIFQKKLLPTCGKCVFFFSDLLQFKETELINFTYQETLSDFFQAKNIIYYNDALIQVSCFVTLPHHLRYYYLKNYSKEQCKEIHIQQILTLLRLCQLPLVE